MTKTTMYQYLGTNGTILSPVHLEDIYYIRKLHLIADKGMTLTNGTRTVTSVTIPEEDFSNWREVPIEGQL